MWPVCTDMLSSDRLPWRPLSCVVCATCTLFLPLSLSLSGRGRVQIEHDSKMRKRRTLIWVRGGPPLVDAEGASISDEDIQKHEAALHEQGQQMEKMLHLDPATRVFGLELAVSNHWGRDGFQDLVANYLMPRKLDCLVISDREQVCAVDLWPVFEWLCRLCDVTIKIVPVPSAVLAVAASASASAAAAATPMEPN
jgi:hypothetical protein